MAATSRCSKAVLYFLLPNLEHCTERDRFTFWGFTSRPVFESVRLSMPTGIDNSTVDRMGSTSANGTPGSPVEYLLTTVLDAVSEGISVHSATGEILWVNKNLCDIYSKSFSELKGSSCQQAFHGEHSTCPHEQVLATGSVVKLDGEVNLSGRILFVTIQPLLDERGGTCGFIRLLRDVTGERRAQQQLLKAERYASLGQILSGIAHDIGTPLNVISGYTEFLLMRTKPDGQNYKELSAILNQTRRIASMVGQALDLAHPPQGRADAIEINTLLSDALTLVGHYLHKTKVKAGLTCRISPPLVYGEAPQLRQAFFNLLLNAGQEVGPGGRLEVVVDEAPDRPGFLAVALAGTEAGGVGHDFSQSLGFLGAQSEAATVGVGLSLAKEVLNAAGARVGFSRSGELGISLVIYLPVNPGSPA